MLVSDGAVISSIFIQSDNALTCMALVLASGPETISCNETVCVVVSVISSPKMFSSAVFFHENIKRCASVWFISVWGAKKDVTMPSYCHARGRYRGWRGRCGARQPSLFDHMGQTVSVSQFALEKGRVTWRVLF